MLVFIAGVFVDINRILLSDMVIVTQQTKKKLKVQKVAPLTSVSLPQHLAIAPNRLAQSSSSNSESRGFVLRVDDTAYTFVTASDQDRDDWIAAFHSAKGH